MTIAMTDSDNLSPLARLGLKVLQESRDNDYGDVDGGWIEDMALELGVLVKVPVTEPCGPGCSCAEWDDFPQECVRYSDEVRALIGDAA